MLQDLRFAIRALTRRPLITAVAVVSLALGIGVNTAIFTLFDQFILRRLPVPQPDGLVVITSPGPKPGSRSTGGAGGIDAIFSYPLFRDLERLGVNGVEVAAHVAFGANLSFKGTTSEAYGLLVSGHYFPALGITPALGRLLQPQDDRVAGGHPVVVLSHDYWRTRFGSDPGVLNGTLIVNGSAMTIVGVAPEGFTGTTTQERPRIFVPVAMAAQAFRDPGWNGMTARNNHWLYLFARLQPGLTREQAESLVNVPFAGLIRDVEYPALRTGMGDRDREQFQRRRLYLQDGARGRSANRTEMRRALLLMFVITGLVLAIACANVANLLLARITDRQSETSVRLSLGGSPARVTRLFLTEAGLLGILGGLAAIAIARVTLDGLIAVVFPGDGAPLTVGIDATVLSFALTLGLLTSLLFGLFPSIHGVRAASRGGLQAHASRATGSKAANRFRASMATVQVALATALLAISGLFLVSLVNIMREELGIKPDGLVVFGLSPYQNGYTPERARAFFERLESELSALPGVSGVTATTTPLLADSNWGNNLTVEGFVAEPGANTNASTGRVSVNYFRTLGIPLLAGREFTLDDTQGSAKVAIVNEAFARKFNLGTRTVGTRMALGAGGNRPLDIEIVGLVGDAKYEDIQEPAPAQFVMPYRQADTGSLAFYVRSRSSDTRAVLGMIPSVVSRLDANLPISYLRTMDDQIWRDMSRARALPALSSAVAGLALILAAIGLYAVLAYGVAQRLREIGIRIALGARPHDVRRLVFAQVGRVGIAGALIGGGLGLAFGRVAQTVLFGVQGYNPFVIGGAVVLALAVAFGAAAIPARRASLVQPVTVLKAE
jgi:predicted permease